MISEPIERNRLFAVRLEKAALNFRKHGFECFVVSTPEKARDFFFSRIQPGMTVGFGGSRTIVELGVLDNLRASHEITLLDRMREGISKEEKGAIERACFSSDVFLASANAAVESGVLVNIDKWGNRTAAIEFGPKKVYLFVGRNKMVANLDAGIARAHNDAASMNNMRFENKTPCVIDGKCHDCASPDRICSTLSVVMRCAPAERICVVLINADLGF